MRILVLDGSPRRGGTVHSLLKRITDGLRGDNEVEWIEVCSLEMKNCTGCMACREERVCVLPEDDAHRVGQKIDEADALIIGTPVYWGNMCAPLKLLFDRNVPVFMAEGRRGLPSPRQKGKRVALATACSAPWPVNALFPESRGALRTVRQVLRSGGYKVVGAVVKPGTRTSSAISERLEKKANRLGILLTR